MPDHKIVEELRKAVEIHQLQAREDIERKCNCRVVKPANYIYQSEGGTMKHKS